MAPVPAVKYRRALSTIVPGPGCPTRVVLSPIVQISRPKTHRKLWRYKIASFPVFHSPIIVIHNSLRKRNYYNPRGRGSQFTVFSFGTGSFLFLTRSTLNNNLHNVLTITYAIITLKYGNCNFLKRQRSRTHLIGNLCFIIYQFMMYHIATKLFTNSRGRKQLLTPEQCFKF